jgi:lysophospholipase L1-like esterase
VIAASRRTVTRTVTWVARLGMLGVAIVVIVAVSLGSRTDSRQAAVASTRSGGYGWVTSWSASPQVAAPGTLPARGFENRTIRNIVFTSVGGGPIRLELTNLFGTWPLLLSDVTVAVAGPGAAVVPGSIHQVTFGGSRWFQIPAGGQVLSDPVTMRVRPLQRLAVSVYLPGLTGPATFHSDAQQVSWVSVHGDHAADQGGGAFAARTSSWYYLSGLITRSPGTEGTVVAFGDSITDGVASAVGANARWPNDLARRLDALHGPTLAVADEGIGGNRVLNDSLCCGASAEARFRRDVLDQPGVRDVIVLEGINDLGFSQMRPHPVVDPVTYVSAAQVIAGYRQLIAQAHARGLRIFGATLLPFAGAGYYTPAAEAKREAINQWIRTSGAFDGVVDFDAVMRDPVDPLLLNPLYDSGDHLHPDDAGYRAMADAVDLGMLLRGPRTPR